MPWSRTNVPGKATDHVDFVATGAAQAWGAAATAAVEEAFAGNTNRRRAADLTGRTQARISGTITVAGAAGWTLAVQYSTDGGTGWAYLDGVDGAKVAIGVTTTTFLAGAWAPIAAAARRDVILRVVGVGGNGVATPTVAHISVELR